MAITGYYWALVGTPGGSGGSSGSVSWHFPQPLSITAQAAVGSMGGTDTWGEVGFSAYVQGGIYKTIGGEGYGSWEGMFFGDNITQLNISARSYDGWVDGSAMGYIWNTPVG